MDSIVVLGMAALQPQLLGRHLHCAAGRPGRAAVPAGILAAGFLLLAMRQLAGPLDALPGQEVIHGWWLLEVTAIWLVPGVCALFRIPGAGWKGIGTCNPWARAASSMSLK